eukprot:CAMPEP_0202978308 /NCGR_PEP_ID=MMETSP1396-20130829/84777_1 /ASSEMBLY_ACC=CAM_ASM_000872 /TAXON_ID= /ORGANISM="Pseudokeronopsis sp., Strain Brazil" /LENGTH=88 /DNA_ID=CAMNT_0049717235 /DNA_START=344 /DNA_END=610 /DNA_ORIENTATION=+
MTTDANGNTEVVMSINNPDIITHMDIEFRNVMMPLVQHNMDKAYDVTLLFKDKQGVTQVEILTFIRSKLAARFGSATVLTRSDDVQLF